MAALNASFLREATAGAVAENRDYDLAPEMSAFQITEKIARAIAEGETTLFIETCESRYGGPHGHAR